MAPLTQHLNDNESTCYCCGHPFLNDDLNWEFIPGQGICAHCECTMRETEIRVLQKTHDNIMSYFDKLENQIKEVLDAAKRQDSGD